MSGIDRDTAREQTRDLVARTMHTWRCADEKDAAHS